MAVMTGIALALAVGGTIMNAVGQKKAGNAAGRAAESQAQQLEYNATVADLQAGDALARGAEDESSFRSQVRGLIGTQRTTLASTGVDVGFGSAADVQADAAYLGEIDARRLVANAQREAWGFRVQADDLRMGADVARQGGQAARTAGSWGAATSVVGGTGSLLLSRYGWERPYTTASAPATTRAAGPF